ncbi:MAG: permease [Candidatus Omnitrophica bacterium]|nr:permease [Candidatus Omnitrophota bacterium]MCF7894370.1 permease [Candidatus Omnitrophota bacterium]
MIKRAKDPVCGMSVDRNKAYKLDYQEGTYYFCSKRCLNRFREKNKVKLGETKSCQSCKKAPFYKNKVFRVASILMLLVVLSYFFPLLVPFRKSLWDYFKIIWWAVLLGFLIGGIIDHYVPRKYISQVLARSGKRTIFYAVFVGFLMSACSHGILALSIQLYKKGASVASVVAFLLASPWANLPLTIIIIGFFGLKALFIIISAIVIAIITGLIFQFLDKKSLIEKNPNSVDFDKNFSIFKDIKKRFKEYKFSLSSFAIDAKGIFEGAVSLANMVLWWILIGVGLASLASAYLPKDLFQQYMGPTIAGLLITLLVATVVEVCSEGSAPMAFEIFRQTKALGNSFVFLMAGVATDYTEIGLIWTNIGKKTAIWLPVITVPQVILLGFVANSIF